NSRPRRLRPRIGRPEIGRENGLLARVPQRLIASSISRFAGSAYVLKRKPKFYPISCRQGSHQLQFSVYFFPAQVVADSDDATSRLGDFLGRCLNAETKP